MRSIQLALCAGVAAAAVIVPAAAAHAAPADNGTEGRVVVTPSTIAAGGEVDLRVDVCRGRHATGTSDAFSSPAHFSPAADRGDLFAEARIRSDAKAGDYQIWVKCKDGGQASGTVTVVHHHEPTHHPTHHATPVAPVHAGGGGTAEVAAADEGGPGTPHTVIGLVLAGVAAVAVAYRSVRRRRRTDSD
ncbi:hypothetical protein J7E96_05925 [Streptomyces sp. ISL-96]|uniref:hypothetical protein n=1 Tax=Streptomyces sp. ISL-96 TaxID=2819191 RepID=UPI001BE65703|nr:hypothetical protein [Streptomyces sp. ISL-96]MBT2488077.1 hypothetical protein [Streptomyces sp. ISL-96]